MSTFYLIFSHNTQSHLDLFSLRHSLQTRAPHFGHRAPVLKTSPNGERHLAQTRADLISSSLAPLDLISSSSFFSLLKDRLWNNNKYSLKLCSNYHAFSAPPIASSGARISPYSSFFLLSQVLVPCKHLKDSIPLWLSKIIHVNIDIFHHSTYVKIIKFLLVRVSFYHFISLIRGLANEHLLPTGKKKSHSISVLLKFPKHYEFFNNS